MAHRPGVPHGSVVNVCLHPFDAAKHLAWVEQWLSLPHVREWWGQPAANVAEVLAHPPAQHAIIAADDEPVGYLRWQTVNMTDLYDIGVTDIPEGAVDIDIFIGKVSQVDRGIGSAALVQLLARLRSDPSVPLAGMSTSARNARAIRAYERAGFRCHARYDDAEWGDCWIMIARWS